VIGCGASLLPRAVPTTSRIRATAGWTADEEAEMPRGVLMVFGDASAPEREEEFNRWYDDHHLGDLLGVPGFCAAARYRRIPGRGGRAAGPPFDQRYLSVYELEGEDLTAVQDTLAAEAPLMDISDALSRDPRPIMVWYEEITPRRTARDEPDA
jgi:hypothetical protein